MSPVSANAEALKTEQAKADAENTKRTGLGLRVRVGQTRGKNPSVINWEAFDESKVDTLPKTLKDFVTVTSAKEDEVVDYLIAGYNASAYAQASDEIGEFINDAWDKETQGQFRLAVRNYAKISGSTIEDAVNLIKPGVEKAFAAKAVAPVA